MKIELPIKQQKIKYTQYGHKYARASDGKAYSPISQVSETRPKDFLAVWTTKMNYEYMLENWDVSKKYTPDEKKELLELARYAADRDSKEAMLLGTKIHDWIEAHIAGQDRLLTSDIKRSVELFLEWEKEYVDKWLASEMLVSSDEWEVAGRLDAIALMKTGKIALIDFKTGNSIYLSYQLQTAGYYKCLDEGGYVVDERIIVRIPKSVYRKVYHPESHSYTMEENLIEMKIIDSDLNEDLTIFKTQIPLYLWLKKNEKR